MRIQTVQRICRAFHITPDEILTAENEPLAADQDALFARLQGCRPKEKETALALLATRSLPRAHPRRNGYTFSYVPSFCRTCGIISKSPVFPLQSAFAAGNDLLQFTTYPPLLQRRGPGHAVNNL